MPIRVSSTQTHTHTQRDMDTHTNYVFHVRPVDQVAVMKTDNIVQYVIEL